MSQATFLSCLMDGVQTLPNVLTILIISIIATYLTGVWGLSIISVAVIVNLYSGIVSIVPLGLKFIVDAFIGNYWIVLLSRFAFTAGFVLLTMSTPPVLSWATGTCSMDEPQCIGQVQVILFYTALFLIAVAVSCHATSGLRQGLSSLIKNEGESERLTTPSQANNRTGFCCEVHLALALILLVPSVSLAVIGYVNPWSVKFGVPAIFVVVSLILFLIDSGSYHPQPRAETSSVSHIFKKKHSRSILFLIPISITFILLGVVSSIGNTFFIEQAVDMNHDVESLRVTILILPLVQHSYKKTKPLSNLVHPKLGIAFSMICAVLSCITAAKVETRRLGVVTSQGVIDEPEEIIPMTMFWLVPQFSLLGLSEAISEPNISDFFTNELAVEPSDDEETKAAKRKYMEFFAQALSGVGTICGLVLVYIVRAVTAANGGTSWFGDTLNTSRLDNYYWTLATLSAANFGLFVVVVFSHHICSDSWSVEDEQRSSSTVPLMA